MACEPMGPAIELRIRNGSVSEVLTLLAVLRTNVSVQIGCGSETYLFVRQVFCGPPCALERLRARLADRTPVEVMLSSHDALAGLYGGKPITALELVLDPEDTLG